MKEQKSNINIKSLLSNIDKINSSFFKNNTKNRRASKQKDNPSYKKIGNEYSTNPNLKKHENNYEFNNFLLNNNNYINHQKISITKPNPINFQHKRSLSKSIFNSINILKNNNITSNKKSNISYGGINNISHEKNTPPLFINKNKGIILNKVNIFKNVKFRKPSLNNNRIDNNINSSNSNTNTIIQSLSSLNMTSTDMTTSTKRKKENNMFNIKENSSINSNDKISLQNNIHYNNQINHLNNLIKNNNKQNRNKHFYNLTNFNFNNHTTTNSTYQYYKDLLQNSNNIISKIKKPNKANINIEKKNNNKSVQKKKIKDKRSISQIYFGDISQKNENAKKGKRNLFLNNINNNAIKTLPTNKNDGGGTIISDDSVFNNSKRRSSSGTHNDSSKISKGSGTISIDKKNKSFSIDYTYSDDEIQTNRRKKMNKIQIEEENVNMNKIINNNVEENKEIKEMDILPNNDININSLEFRNFCNDLSAKLFGNKI